MVLSKLWLVSIVYYIYDKTLWNVFAKYIFVFVNSGHKPGNVCGH